MDVKLIFCGGKIENAYTCLVVFLKERMLQSCRYTTIDIHNTLMYAYYVQLTIRIVNGNIAIPTVNFLGDASPFPMINAHAKQHAVVSVQINLITCHT